MNSKSKHNSKNFVVHEIVSPNAYRTIIINHGFFCNPVSISSNSNFQFYLNEPLSKFNC